MNFFLCVVTLAPVTLKKIHSKQFKKMVSKSIPRRSLKKQSIQKPDIYSTQEFIILDVYALFLKNPQQLLFSNHPASLGKFILFYHSFIHSFTLFIYLSYYLIAFILFYIFFALSFYIFLESDAELTELNPILPKRRGRPASQKNQLLNANVQLVRLRLDGKPYSPIIK